LVWFRLNAVACLFICLFTVGCGRKDVNRRGDIRLRGERPVSLERRSEGDLLQKGTASWYGEPYHGRKTSNGETYNMWSLTAAHKTLPFGTWVRVVNTENKRETRVRINDRGPFIRGRIIDLSRKAAEAIGMLGTGTAHVKIYLDKGPDTRRKNSVSTTPPVDADGHWVVQIASFREGHRAVQFADSLATTYPNIRIERAQGFFRVRLGPYSSRRDADKIVGKLKADGHRPWVAWIPNS